MDSFTIDVHTDLSEIHESYHHQSQDTVFKAMQRRRSTYCTKSLQSKKCIAHGPTAESLIFGWSCVKKTLKLSIFIHQQIKSCTFPTTPPKKKNKSEKNWIPLHQTAIFHEAPRRGYQLQPPTMPTQPLIETRCIACKESVSDDSLLDWHGPVLQSRGFPVR